MIKHKQKLKLKNGKIKGFPSFVDDLKKKHSIDLRNTWIKCQQDCSKDNLTLALKAMMKKYKPVLKLLPD